jgi:hypothetical protein
MRFTTALFAVMLFADTVALAVLRLTPLPIVAIMGGVRLTESERLIQNLAFLIGVLGVLSWPVWLIGLSINLVFARKHDWIWPGDAPPRAAPSAWIMAAGLVIAGGALLPFTQLAQQRRWQVENDLRAGRIDEALAYMSRYDRGDFPTHWDPPPRVGYGQRQPPMASVMRRCMDADLNVSPWVQDLFDEKMENYLKGYEYVVHGFVSANDDHKPKTRWRDMSLIERQEVLDRIDQLSEWQARMILGGER